MKKVANIVFYKFFSEKEDVQIREQACIFYDDGTVASVSVDEAVEAAHQIAVEDKIKTKEEFRQSVNKAKIHVMSGEDFERRFQEFVIKPAETAKVKKLTPADYQMTQEAWDDYIAEGFEPGTPDFDSAVILDGTGRVPAKEETPVAVTPTPVATTAITPRVAPVVPAVVPTVPRVTPAAPRVTPTAPKVTPTIPVVVPTVPRVTPAAPRVTPTAPKVTPTIPVVVPTVPKVTPTVPKVTPTVPRVTPTVPKVTPTAPKVTPVVVPIVNPTTPKVTPRVTPTVTPVPRFTPTTTSTKPPKKKNIFQRAIDKLKKNKVVRNIAIGVTALAIALFGYSCGARQTQTGQMVSPVSIEQTMLEETSQQYIRLLKQTKNETQKDSMMHASYMMDNYNTTFANAYLQQGSEVKAALTWDEMMALNLAYNDYSPEQISAMFNGAEIDATTFSNAYKNGTLQLMGAYVIADDEDPVNSYKFLRDEQQQEFVKKYEYLFYAAKNAETEEQMIERVNAFYAELHKDFPITDEVRTQGISHAEGRAQIEPYKLAVTPIVAASEMMFQNLSIDHTLSDSAIAYFNDLGLCNLADSIFEKAMYITLTDETDKKSPTYDQFKATKIAELEAEDSYNIGDAERDLSQLDEFKYWVNGFYLEKFGYEWQDGKLVYTTHTSTHTVTRTETTTTTTDNRDEAVQAAGEDKVQAAEDAVDAELEKENEEAKKKAEEEAEKKRQEEQAKADEERKKQEEQVRQDEEDLQQDIEDANQEIENGGTVNEDDFGDHGVDFDDEYEDGNGNLDPSVENITTDGTGAVDGDEELPDADSLGDVSTTTSYSAAAAAEESAPVTNTSDQVVYEYEEPVTYEQMVDEYIRGLEQQGQEATNEAGYSK